MEAPEVFRMLTRRIRRGFWICLIFFCLTSALGMTLLILSVGRQWAVLSFVAAMHFYVWRIFAARKMRSAVTVSQNPHHVYWVRPTTIQLSACSDTFIALHLRDGAELEVGLPIDEVRRFVAWLSEHNPSLRIGAYDSDGDIPEEWK